MALMTVCPACTTYFKVVSDQLLLHHGMVRCGSCDHVFDANERLEVLDEGSYAEIMLMRQDSNHTEETQTTNEWRNDNSPVAKILTAETPSSVNTNTDQTPEETDALGTAFTKLRLDTPSALDFFSPQKTTPDYQISNLKLPNTHLIADSNLNAQPANLTNLIDDSKPSDIADKRAAIKTTQLLEIEQKAKLLKMKTVVNSEQVFKNHLSHPSNHFKRRIKHSKPSLWSKSRLMVYNLLNHSIVAMTWLAVIALIAQTMLWARYPIMNLLPASTVIFKPLCQLTGCVDTPAAWLKPLSLDGLSLNKLNINAATIQGLSTYRMQATIRNTSRLAIQSPDIELTISTLEGEILAKKILSNHNFPPVPASAGFIPAQTDWIIDVPINLDENTVNYSARLVYQPVNPLK
jgi:predicted Zn finger-like uncharacterized protein